MYLTSSQLSHRSRNAGTRALVACGAPVFALSAMHGASAQDAASSPTARAAAAVVQVQARVAGIDPVTNSVTLQGPQGRMAEVAANPEIGDVKKLQLGDTVNIEYRNPLLVCAAKVKSNGVTIRPPIMVCHQWRPRA